MGASDMKSFVAKCCGSVVVTVFIVIFSAVPISMIVMGAIHKDDCPVEDMIPIYLIVMGAFTLLRSVVSLGMRAKSSDGEENPVNPVSCILDLFLFAWFVAGCVYIYRTKDDFQSSDSKADDYCDYTFYWYSFWVTTASFIVTGAILVITCFVACCLTVCR